MRKSADRVPSLRFLHRHLPYNWGKSTEKPKWDKTVSEHHNMREWEEYGIRGYVRGSLGLQYSCPVSFSRGRFGSLICLCYQVKGWGVGFDMKGSSGYSDWEDDVCVLGSDRCHHPLIRGRKQVQSRYLLSVPIRNYGQG